MFNLLKKIFALVFLITITFTSLTCKKSPNEPNAIAKFLFTFEDASCTEAWFNLKLNNLTKPVLVNVYRDNFLDKSFNIYTTDDTTFYIENLFPKRNYEVYVEVQPKNEKVYRSSILRFTTMDTTSHDFTWQVFEFGECASSVLYDVAIIDENDIWAVGEIYMRDSLGRCDPNAYNAIHWDGQKWELKRIPIYLSSGPFYPVIRTICVFNKNDIWFGAIHWDGTRYTLKNKDFPTMPNGDGWQVNKMWGTSSSDLYAVGDNGNIAHWDGVRWRKIESGTELHLYDIYGAINKKSNDTIILIVGSSNTEYKNIILQIKNKSVKRLSSEPIVWDFYSTWFYPEKRYYVVGDGIYEKRSLREPYWRGQPRAISNYGKSCVRGSNINNVFVVGAFGELLHFNGIRWKSYIDEIGRIYGAYVSIDVRDNIVCVVGGNGNYARIVIIRKK